MNRIYELLAVLVVAALLMTLPSPFDSAVEVGGIYPGPTLRHFEDLLGEEALGGVAGEAPHLAVLGQNLLILSEQERVVGVVGPKATFGGKALKIWSSEVEAVLGPSVYRDELCHYECGLRISYGKGGRVRQFALGEVPRDLIGVGY